MGVCVATVSMLYVSKNFCRLRTLVEKWKTTLQGAPTSVKLWIKYLDFQQTTFKTFTYDNLRDTYVQIVQVIKDVISAPDTDSDGTDLLPFYG